MATSKSNPITQFLPSGESFYPSLSKVQQQNLPKLIKATPLPKMFDDSTHQLWDCETKQDALILKVCNSESVLSSSFWQGMKYLFNVDLPKQLGEFENVYKVLSKISAFTIPEYIASGSATENSLAFIACKKISGTMVLPENVSDDMVIQLAEHLVRLHQQKQVTWGRINDAKFDVSDWSGHLQKTLKLLVKNTGNIPEKLLDEMLDLAGKIMPNYFVPIMPDLRWDQFLQKNDKLTALVDLDAFVYGPRELEFILLEYILNNQQAKLFASFYSQFQPLPQLEQVREPYRLLLFLMNVLGESKVDNWMKAPFRWE